MKSILLIICFFIKMNIFANKIDNFTLPIYDTKEEFNLAHYSKNYERVYLNFWASWCSACIQEIDELEGLKSKYVDKKILFIAINAGEKRKKIKRFLTKNKFSYLILEDSDRRVSKQLGVTELPRSIIIDKNRNILYSSDRPPKEISF